jgi:hypothetical protein
VEIKKRPKAGQKELLMEKSLKVKVQVFEKGKLVKDFVGEGLVGVCLLKDGYGATIMATEATVSELSYCYYRLKRLIERLENDVPELPELEKDVKVQSVESVGDWNDDE